MTGKQIMDHTASATNGGWRPSPGLVYPLLGKLLSDGLIAEDANGGYRTTPAGQQVLAQYESGQAQLQNLFGTFVRIGVFGKLMTQDIVDRVISTVTIAREELLRMSDGQKAKYRAFLQAELDRLNRFQEEKRKAPVQ